MWRLVVCVLLVEGTAGADSKPCLADELPALRYDAKLPKCARDAAKCQARCDTGDGSACVSLALNVQDADRVRADALYERACRLGYSLGCTNWAAEAWAEKPISWSCLDRVFTKACEVDDHWACTMRGRLLLQHVHQPWMRAFRTKVQGYIRLRTTCDRLGRESCRFLAWYTEKGVLGAVDHEAIDTLMKRACDTGDGAACGDHATVDETVDKDPQ